jgi:hypothetical protein
MYAGELLVTNSFFHNISQLNFALEDASAISLAESINGTSVIPAGRYLCMIIRSPGNSKTSSGMIILDLKDKEGIANKIANKLENKILKEKFMLVYHEIQSHPENHELFTLVSRTPATTKSNRVRFTLLT